MTPGRPFALLLSQEGATATLGECWEALVQDKEVLEEDLDPVVLDQVVLETTEPGPEGSVQAARAQVYST